MLADSRIIIHPNDHTIFTTTRKAIYRNGYRCIQLIYLLIHKFFMRFRWGFLPLPASTIPVGFALHESLTLLPQCSQQPLLLLKHLGIWIGADFSIVNLFLYSCYTIELQARPQPTISITDRLVADTGRARKSSERVLYL